MTLKIEKVKTDEGQEARYAITVEHNGQYAEAEISEINIKEQLKRERMAQSNIAIPMSHVPRG